jgi:hypothetical protein
MPRTFHFSRRSAHSALSAGLALLASLLVSGPAARAQSCTLSGDIAQVSVASGGTQNLTIVGPPSFHGQEWYMVGSFHGTLPGHPVFAYGGLYLNQDRYFIMTVIGRSPFLRGGLNGGPGGVMGQFDPNGMASIQVVVPPGIYASLVGRTVYHGYYRLHPLTLLPDCGSNTVALTFVP